MVDWVEKFSPDAWARITDGIQWGLTMVAVIVGWKGFRMSERDAMEVVKLSGENRRLKTKIAQLELERDCLN